MTTPTADLPNEVHVPKILRPAGPEPDLRGRDGVPKPLEPATYAPRRSVSTSGFYDEDRPNAEAVPAEQNEPKAPPEPPGPSQAEGGLELLDFAVRQRSNGVSILTLELRVPDRLVGAVEPGFNKRLREEMEGEATKALAASSLLARRLALLAALDAAKARQANAHADAAASREEVVQVETSPLVGASPADVGRQLLDLDQRILDAEVAEQAAADDVKRLTEGIADNQDAIEPVALHAFADAQEARQRDAMAALASARSTLQDALQTLPEAFSLIARRLECNLAGSVTSLTMPASVRDRCLVAALVTLGWTPPAPPPPPPAPPAPAEPVSEPVAREQVEADAVSDLPSAELVPEQPAEGESAETVSSPVNGGLKIPRADYPTIAARHAAGETTAQIAATYDVDRSRISQVLALVREQQEADQGGAS